MKFHKIDLQTWKRREYFEHYVSSIPCTYSLTVKLDITKIREKTSGSIPPCSTPLQRLSTNTRNFVPHITLRENWGFMRR